MPQHAARSDPGGDMFDDIPFLVGSGLNKGRDQIAMGRHDNLYDRPNLACPELDLSAYNTGENAADFADLQRVATAGPVPAPVVSDAFDVKTGSSGAKDMARDPSRPTAVQIPGIGHRVLQRSPCPQRSHRARHRPRRRPRTRTVHVIPK
ncbi:hypothetical protein [Streptomyces virginiae]|uniref:hypothetical protein n=1 Tax=Streptomyces virginiae TaxID=1961 RepID=UPI002256F939|nr:hypothetical protein [Streptomyces virginiae]MCX5180784.1 hypothetical protein [Streptomyces virginiae]